MTAEKSPDVGIVARGLHYALAAWIAGSALFFYLRFTFAFVHANQDAIRALLNP